MELQTQPIVPASMLIMQVKYLGTCPVIFLLHRHPGRCEITMIITRIQIDPHKGVGYTTGVMLDSLMQDLGGGRGRVALVGSIQVSEGHTVN